MTMPHLSTCLALVCCSLATLLPAASAQPAEALRLLDEGNQHYLQGDYDAALEAYQSALASGYAGGLLYYNMGNTYYRLDNLGQAVRHYEKARRLIPENRELLHNLQIAQARTTDQFSALPTPFWVVWWRKVAGFFGPGGFFAVGVVFYLATAGLLGYRLLRGTRGPWHRRALTISVLAGGLLLLAAFSTSVYESRPHTGVVLTREVPVRQGPTSEAEVEITIHEGLILTLLRTDGEWMEVQLPNGVTGWIQSQHLGFV